MENTHFAGFFRLLKVNVKGEKWYAKENITI